jgi:hypothetical protein
MTVERHPPNRLHEKEDMMKWKNGLTTEERIRRMENWHSWFAWFPVVIGVTDDQHYIKAWLTHVERKGTFVCHWMEAFWTYEYREGGHNG